jgi:hypothetical protein
VPDKRGCKATFPLLIALFYFSCQTRPLEAAISVPGRKLNSTLFLTICRQSQLCRQLFIRLHWHLITCFPMLSYFYLEKTRIRVVSILTYPLKLFSQSQTLFKVLCPKTGVHSIHAGPVSHWLQRILPLPFRLNHTQKDDSLQRLFYSTLLETNLC